MTFFIEVHVVTCSYCFVMLNNLLHGIHYCVALRLQEWFSLPLQNMIGQFPLDEQIHIDSLTQHWDRFASVIDDREQALHAEAARLQRLQKLAEKVHKDTKLCEGYLDDVEQRLVEVGPQAIIAWPTTHCTYVTIIKTKREFHTKHEIINTSLSIFVHLSIFLSIYM